jgi:hypothetical protein
VKWKSSLKSRRKSFLFGGLEFMALIGEMINVPSNVVKKLYSLTDKFLLDVLCLLFFAHANVLKMRRIINCIFVAAICTYKRVELSDFCFFGGELSTVK